MTNTVCFEGYDKLSPCLQKCVNAHESVHRQQCHSWGYRGYWFFNDLDLWSYLEKPAYEAERECLERLLGSQ